MSHVVTIQTQIRDFSAMALACQRLGLPPPKQGSAQLFSESAEGVIVELPAWRYPVVCQTSSGTLKYDNYGGAWGQPQELDRFLQAYAVEKAKLEARRRGHAVSEQQLSDGSIRVTIQVAGGVA